LEYLLDFYRLSESDEKADFFNKNNFFDKLIGDAAIKEMILNGKTAEEIQKTWTSDLDKYKDIRKKYLIYPED
jgi:uncharacterized protein YbbC (DUF1343 family)